MTGAVTALETPSPVKTRTTTRAILESLMVAVVFTALSYAVAVTFGWVEEVNWLEAFAVFTSYSCTYLCVVQKRINYPIGAVSNAAYCVLFFQSGLYASTFLTGYLTFALIYGWFRWRSDQNSIPVRHVEVKWLPVYIGVTALTYAIAYFGITALGGTMAPADAIILIGSLLAQFLLDNKRLETWAVWAVVNIAAIYTYFSSGLPLAGLQYVFFLGNTLYGWYMWRASMKASPANATVFPVTKEKSRQQGLS